MASELTALLRNDPSLNLTDAFNQVSDTVEAPDDLGNNLIPSLLLEESDLDQHRIEEMYESSARAALERFVGPNLQK